MLGRHRGLPCYTTGQRKGLGVGGSAYPLYVLRKDAKTNTVVLGPEEHLYSGRTVIEQCNWIAFEDLAEPVRCTAKTRYSQTEAAATVSPLPGGRAEVVFDTPQRALTAGQSAVRRRHCARRRMDLRTGGILIWRRNAFGWPWAARWAP